MKNAVKTKQPVEKPQSVYDKEVDNWDVLPCEGVYKLSKDEPITYSHCKAPYWQCPNKNCIMNLV